MNDKELKTTAAILLAGMIAGEGTTNDERSVKRAIDLAYKLMNAIAEKQTSEFKPVQESI